MEDKRGTPFDLCLLLLFSLLLLIRDLFMRVDNNCVIAFSCLFRPYSSVILATAVVFLFTMLLLFMSLVYPLFLESLC